VPIRKSISLKEGVDISSDDVVKGYEVDGWSLIPNRGKIFLFSKVFKQALGPTLAYPVGTEGPFEGVKWLGRESDHSLSTTAQVKNGEVTPPLLHVFMAVLSSSGTDTSSFMDPCFLDFGTSWS
jgi:hypothetical protein